MSIIINESRERITEDMEAAVMRYLADVEAGTVDENTWSVCRL